MYYRKRLFVLNHTPTTEIYTLSLHDALPISNRTSVRASGVPAPPLVSRHVTATYTSRPPLRLAKDRKSTRLNSSHANISYAVFCLKKKNTDDLKPLAAPAATAGRLTASYQLA